MRIAVISDTHMPKGARRLPSACVERLRGADLIVHGGDLTGRAFYEELLGLGPPLEAVAGNIDEPGLQRALPEALVVEAAGVRIGVLHIPGPSLGRAERLCRRFPGCDAVVFGHTHLPVVERHAGVWLLNPGSPTERRRAPARTMLELQVEAREIRPTLVTFDP